MLVGIDNYGLYPLALDPLETLRWAKSHGAQGVQFSGFTPEQQTKMDAGYLSDLAQLAWNNGLYLEWGGAQHIPLNMETWKEKDIFEANRTVAREASKLGIRPIRSCSGGLMRWHPENPPTKTLLDKTAEALKSQRHMLEDYGVTLAIETHFEFTTHELLRLFEMCGAEPGGYLGICLDTMNLLTMLEDPVLATERILPWVVCTHIKDGGLLLNSKGLTSFPTPTDQGIINFKKIIQRLATLPWEINLSVEDHGGKFQLPIFEPSFLSEFPDLTSEELSRLVQLTLETKEKGDTGQCNITQREDWPECCEERIWKDIRALKNLVTMTF